MRVLLVACARAWTFPAVTDLDSGPSPRVPGSVHCDTALAGATLTTYPGESLLLSGSTASADPAAHYDCPVTLSPVRAGHQRRAALEQLVLLNNPEARSSFRVVYPHWKKRGWLTKRLDSILKRNGSRRGCAGSAGGRAAANASIMPCRPERGSHRPFPCRRTPRWIQGLSWRSSRTAGATSSRSTRAGPQ